MATTKQHGGSRPKRRPDDARGGARATGRPSARGRPVRRIQLNAEAAQELRILASARLGSAGADACERMVTALIHRAWLEYDAEIMRQVEQVEWSGIPL